MHLRNSSPNYSKTKLPNTNTTVPHTEIYVHLHKTIVALVSQLPNKNASIPPKKLLSAKVGTAGSRTKAASRQKTEDGRRSVAAGRVVEALARDASAQTHPTRAGTLPPRSRIVSAPQITELD